MPTDCVKRLTFLEIFYRPLKPIKSLSAKVPTPRLQALRLLADLRRGAWQPDAASWSAAVFAARTRTARVVERGKWKGGVLGWQYGLLALVAHVEHLVLGLVVCDTTRISGKVRKSAGE